MINETIVPSFSQYLNEAKMSNMKKIAKDIVKMFDDEYDITKFEDLEDEGVDMWETITEYIYDNFGQKEGDSMFVTSKSGSFEKLSAELKKLGWEDPEYNESKKN